MKRVILLMLLYLLVCICASSVDISETSSGSVLEYGFLSRKDDNQMPNETKSISEYPACDCGPNSSNCTFNDTGFKQCTCLRGYEQRDFICDDINECQNTTLHNCTHEMDCLNTIGNYRCVCKLGFIVVDAYSKHVECEDIDECQLSPCNSISEECHNTHGSYHCYCKSDYQYDLSGKCSKAGVKRRVFYIEMIAVIGAAMVLIIIAIMYGKRRYCRQGPIYRSGRPGEPINMGASLNFQEKNF